MTTRRDNKQATDGVAILEDLFSDEDLHVETVEEKTAEANHLLKLIHAGNLVAQVSF